MRYYFLSLSFGYDCFLNFTLVQIQQMSGKKRIFLHEKFVFVVRWSAKVADFAISPDFSSFAFDITFITTPPSYFDAMW